MQEKQFAALFVQESRSFHHVQLRVYIHFRKHDDQMITVFSLPFFNVKFKIIFRCLGLLDNSPHHLPYSHFETKFILCPHFPAGSQRGSFCALLQVYIRWGLYLIPPPYWSRGKCSCFLHGLGKHLASHEIGRFVCRLLFLQFQRFRV